MPLELIEISQKAYINRMKKLQFNKLIRDKVSKNMLAKGIKFETRTLPDKEFEKELFRKITEESSALKITENNDSIASEIADLIAVIDEIKKIRKISSASIEKHLKLNFEKKGGFKKKIFLLWTNDDGYKTNEKKSEKCN